MAAATERARFRRRERKICKSPSFSDDDCGSLTWLLSFRLDPLVPASAEDQGQNGTVLPPPVEHKVSPEREEMKLPHQRKPPYTYPELIQSALREKGELTVSAIYQWISDRFPYYKANDERWKNSVRHNLSINPHFRKGGRAPQGAGHLWSLAANAIDLLPVRNNSYQSVIVLDEAAIAAASIMPDNEFMCGANDELCMSTAAFLNPVSAEQVVLESGLLSAE